MITYDGISQPCHQSNSDGELHGDREPHVNTSGEPKRRSVARVLHYVHFSPVADAEKSAREKLMLFTHWRNETVEVNFKPIFRTLSLSNHNY